MKNNYYSSRATVKDDRIVNIDYVIEKEKIAQFYKDKKEYKVIAIGDGSNDVKILEIANVGIAF